MRPEPERPLFPHPLCLDQLFAADGYARGANDQAGLLKKDKHVIA